MARWDRYLGLTNVFMGGRWPSRDLVGEEAGLWVGVGRGVGGS